MSWSLAIDFGTSNTAAAYRIGDEAPRPVRLSDQAHQMPSAVLAVDGGIRVGTEAVRAQRVAPESYLESPKLHAGQDAVLLGETEVEVADLISAVLGHAARRAARVAGSDVPDRVILTHPYEWAEPRKNALLAAWQRTGIATNDVRLVSEPVAAVSWFAASAPPPVGSHVGVFDFGGGTCDIAVLKHSGDPTAPFQVVGHDGRADLGGRTIDHLLLGHLRRTLVRMGHGDVEQALAARENLAALRTLQDHVRQAKHALSDYEDAMVPVVVGGADLSVVLTAGELAHLVEAPVDEARALTERAIEQAGIKPAELYALYLTGGSSQLRPVASMLEDLLGGRPATLDDPKLVVAKGAHLAVEEADTPRSAQRTVASSRVKAVEKPTRGTVASSRAKAVEKPTRGRGLLLVEPAVATSEQRMVLEFLRAAGLFTEPFPRGVGFRPSFTKKKIAGWPLHSGSATISGRRGGFELFTSEGRPAGKEPAVPPYALLFQVSVDTRNLRDALTDWRRGEPVDPEEVIPLVLTHDSVRRIRAHRSLSLAREVDRMVSGGIATHVTIIGLGPELSRLAAAEEIRINSQADIVPLLRRVLRRS